MGATPGLSGDGRGAVADNAEQDRRGEQAAQGGQGQSD
jgi:hypothetical protein